MNKPQIITRVSKKFCIWLSTWRKCTDGISNKSGGSHEWEVAYHLVRDATAIDKAEEENKTLNKKSQMSIAALPVTKANTHLIAITFSGIVLVTIQLILIT